MGQSDSQQIQECVKDLVNQKVITLKQSQLFIRDFNNHQSITEDVRKFDQNQLKYFLKYFLLNKYQANVLESTSQTKNLNTEINHLNLCNKKNNQLQSIRTLGQNQSFSMSKSLNKQNNNKLVKVMRINSNNLTMIQSNKINTNLKQFNLYSTQFNILEYQGKSKELKFIITNILYECQYIKKNQTIKKYLDNNKNKLNLFLTQLEKGYQEKKNKFHNFMHGINVMHNVFLMINNNLNFIENNKENILSQENKQNQRINSFLSDFSKFILIFSGLCHDFAHTGYNNAFQIATQSPLALRFNDSSPLQNYHIQRTLQLLKNDQLNFLNFLTKEQLTKFRKLFISNILFTDIKQHFSLLKKFQEQFKPNTKSINFQNQKILCGMIIHSSDFAGSVKQHQISLLWSKRVNQQFTNQSNKQKQLNIPLTPFLLNLDNPLVLIKNQIGFLKFFVQPLYKALAQFEQTNQHILTMYLNVNKNIAKNQQTKDKLQLEEKGKSQTSIKKF